MDDERRGETKENVSITFQEDKATQDQKNNLEVEEIEVEDLVIDGICGVY